MNVKFMNPFVTAASEVLQAEALVTVKRGELSLQKTSFSADEITVLISMIGQVQGVAIFSMSRETALGLVSRMMDQTFSEFDNLAQSGIAELGNVITGRASVMLSEAGFDSLISPPTMVQGEGTRISTLDFPRVVVPLNTLVGTIEVHLALRETPPGQQDENFLTILSEMREGAHSKFDGSS